MPLPFGRGTRSSRVRTARGAVARRMLSGAARAPPNGALQSAGRGERSVHRRLVPSHNRAHRVRRPASRCLSPAFGGQIVNRCRACIALAPRLWYSEPGHRSPRCRSYSTASVQSVVGAGLGAVRRGLTLVVLVGGTRPCRGCVGPGRGRRRSGPGTRRRRPPGSAAAVCACSTTERTARSGTGPADGTRHVVSTIHLRVPGSLPALVTEDRPGRPAALRGDVCVGADATRAASLRCAAERGVGPVRARSRLLGGAGCRSRPASQLNFRRQVTTDALLYHPKNRLTASRACVVPRCTSCDDRGRPSAAAETPRFGGGGGGRRCRRAPCERCSDGRRP